MSQPLQGMGWPGFGGWRGSSACSGPLRPSSSRSRSRSRRRGRQRRSRSRWSAGSRRGTRLNLPPPRGPAAPPKEAGGAAGALLSVANIRRWAHVPEFFLQGLFLFGAAALWPQGRHGARRGQGGRAAVCAVAAGQFRQARARARRLRQDAAAAAGRKLSAAAHLCRLRLRLL